MGITPYELIQMQKAGKPQSGNLLDMPRPHGNTSREQVQIRSEAREFAANRITHEQAIERLAQENALATWTIADDENGFKEFQQQIHALEQPVAEEDLDGLSQVEFDAKMTEAQDRANQQEADDRRAWKTFKNRPTSQFLRQHQEISDNDITQIDLQLTEWKLPTAKASLEQLNEADAVKSHGLSRPITVQKPAAPTFNPETCSMEQLEAACGGRVSEPQIGVTQARQIALNE